MRSWCVKVGLSACLLFVGMGSPADAQVSGVRTFSGGVGAIFNLVGFGSLYVDPQGTQGYLYNSSGLFESYNFNQLGGQHWSGGQGLLGPQLSIGLIQGTNQTGAPTVLVPPPRQLPPAPLPAQVDELTLDVIP